MQPQQLRKLARKWSLPVLGLTLASALLVYLFSRSLTPVYDAKGDILVVAGPGQTTNVNLNLNAQQVTTTAATLITEPPLLQRVIDANHLNESVDTLARQVTATPQSNTELVDVVVRDTSPVRAATIANALMTGYVAQVTKRNSDRINQAGATLQAQINQVQATISQENAQLASPQQKGQDTTALRSTISANTALLTELTLNYSSFKATQSQNLETVSVAAPAATPLVPASPRVNFNAAVGAALGLLLGLGVAALFEYFDQGLNSADDVRERLGVPCLGVVPRYRTERSGSVTVNSRQQRDVEASTEAYRRLRTNLLFASPDNVINSVVVTSARAGEGKTRTAANLAVALASFDKRVVLIDADMRRPSQHRIFGKSLENGMSELILRTTPETVPALNGSHGTDYPHLSVITSGTMPPDPSELLASKRAGLLFKSLAESHDMLVIDTPPAAVLTDALAVASAASAVIVVVEAGRTNASQAGAVIDSLTSVGANVIGVVLNKVKSRADAGYYYQHGYADARAAEAATPADGPLG